MARARPTIEPGQRFGELVVIAAPFLRKGNIYVRCRCACGEERVVRPCLLRRDAIRTDCVHVPGKRRRPAAAESGQTPVAEEVSAGIQPRPRLCGGCGGDVVEATLRASDDIVVLEPQELFARGPCPRCDGRGTLHAETCPTCGGRRIVGVSLEAGILHALDASGRARAIAPAQRNAGDALHFAHACALELTARSAA